MEGYEGERHWCSKQGHEGDQLLAITPLLLAGSQPDPALHHAHAHATILGPLHHSSRQPGLHSGQAHGEKGYSPGVGMGCSTATAQCCSTATAQGCSTDTAQGCSTDAAQGCGPGVGVGFRAGACTRDPGPSLHLPLPVPPPLRLPPPPPPHHLPLPPPGHSKRHKTGSGRPGLSMSSTLPEVEALNWGGRRARQRMAATRDRQPGNDGLDLNQLIWPALLGGSSCGSSGAPKPSPIPAAARNARGHGRAVAQQGGAGVGGGAGLASLPPPLPAGVGHDHVSNGDSRVLNEPSLPFTRYSYSTVAVGGWGEYARSVYQDATGRWVRGGGGGGWGVGRGR